MILGWQYYPTNMYALTNGPSISLMGHSQQQTGSAIFREQAHRQHKKGSGRIKVTVKILFPPAEKFNKKEYKQYFISSSEPGKLSSSRAF